MTGFYKDCLPYRAWDLGIFQFFSMEASATFIFILFFKAYKCSLCRVSFSRIRVWNHCPMHFSPPERDRAAWWERLSSGVAEDTSGGCPVRAGSSQPWLSVSEDNEKISVERNSWIWALHLHTICILAGYWWLGMLDMLWLCIFWFPVICKRDPSKM